MSDKDKGETLRRKARRAAYDRLKGRDMLIDVIIRERILQGDKHL